MKKRFLVVVFIVVLLISAGAVLARPVNQNGQPGYPAPPTATIHIWPTATETATPTNTPESEQSKPKPTTTRLVSIAEPLPPVSPVPR
jgi:hypothetical protein